MSLDSPPIPPTQPSSSHQHNHRSHTRAPVRFFHVALITGPLVLFVLLGLMQSATVSTEPEDMATQLVSEPIPSDYPACGLPCGYSTDCSAPMVCDQSPAVWVRQGDFYSETQDAVWKMQPSVNGAQSWELAGITGGWYIPTTKLLTVVSQDRYWMLDTDRQQWQSHGTFHDLPEDHVWKQQPKINGLFAWEGPDGITASWYMPDSQRLTIVSRNRYWVFHVPTNTWEEHGTYAELPDRSIWKRQPAVAGGQAWDQAGITGGWYRSRDKILTIISGNRYWNLDMEADAWTTSGTFDQLPEEHIWKRQPKVHDAHAWTVDGRNTRGITAAWVYPESNELQIVSRDRYWVLRLEAQPVCKIPSCVGTTCTCSTP